jgi:hypothetical protein
MVLMAISVYAHSGGTDGNGGHYDHSTGDYHYHHGYSAHEHYDIDGDGKKDCPYTFDYDSINNGEGDADEEVKNTTKKNKTFWSVCGDILVCFIFAIIAFPLINILLGIPTLLSKKIANWFDEHTLLIYIISFVLTWTAFTIGYFMFNYQ